MTAERSESSATGTVRELQRGSSRPHHLSHRLTREGPPDDALGNTNDAEHPRFFGRRGTSLQRYDTQRPPSAG